MSLIKRVLYAERDGEILQWQDTQQFDYGAAPAGTALLEITEHEWQRQSSPTWVSNGQLTHVKPDIPLPTPSPALVVMRNTATKRRILADTSRDLAPLQHAADLGIADPHEARLLKQLKLYMVEVHRVDVSHPEPDWPSQPKY